MTDQSRASIKKTLNKLSKEGSSVDILHKIKSQYASLRSISIDNDQIVTKNLESIKETIIEPGNSIQNKPLP